MHTDTTNNMPDLLDVFHTPLMRAEEVADLLSVRTSTVYELSRRRRDPLPSVRIGRAKRFDRRAIMRWVEMHATM